MIARLGTCDGGDFRMKSAAERMMVGVEAGPEGQGPSLRALEAWFGWPGAGHQAGSGSFGGFGLGRRARRDPGSRWSCWVGPETGLKGPAWVEKGGAASRPALFCGESLQILKIEALAMSEACCSLSFVPGAG
jgi:hypothetical protein